LFTTISGELAMANFTAADVKKLRDLSAAGMMDCKNALVESDGDLDKAIEILRIKGAKGVGKREGRTAANGLIAAAVDGSRSGVLLELNCETDFVAKTVGFQELAAAIAARVVALAPPDVAALLQAEFGDGRSVQQVVDEANATMGEKIEIRRFASFGGSGDLITTYLHKTSPDLPPTIGVMVEMVANTEKNIPESTAREVAQHIAAFSPLYLNRDDIPSAVIADERRIAEATAREEGKPEASLERIVDGRLTGFFKDTVVVEQAFAKDQKKTVGTVLDEAGIVLLSFARFKVGQQ
jgi:elongation factor Ts